MRFANVRLNGAERPGVVADQEIALFPKTVEDFAAPIRRFRRDVLCTGWNYWDHFEEGFGKREGQDVERPKAPTFFSKSPESVIGPNDPIAYDERISRKWDYEAELVVIIGRGGRSIP